MQNTVVYREETNSLEEIGGTITKNIVLEERVYNMVDMASKASGLSFDEEVNDRLKYYQDYGPTPN